MCDQQATACLPLAVVPYTDEHALSALRTCHKSHQSINRPRLPYDTYLPFRERGCPPAGTPPLQSRFLLPGIRDAGERGWNVSGLGSEEDDEHDTAVGTMRARVVKQRSPNRLLNYSVGDETRMAVEQQDAGKARLPDNTATAHLPSVCHVDVVRTRSYLVSA